MPTQLKSDTARANGAKSHGPTTAEGRAKSSRNAVKHGLSSRKRNPLVLECENDDDFRAVHDSQMEIHQPATPAEKDLVDQMVAARWRILRLQGIESGLLDKEMRLKKKLERQFPSGQRVQLSDAYEGQANGYAAMALASRCESRLHRMYNSSYKILRELQAARMKQSTQPEPPPIAAQAANKIYNNEPRAAVVSNASDASNPPHADAEAAAQPPARPPHAAHTRNPLKDPVQ